MKRVLLPVFALGCAVLAAPLYGGAQEHAPALEVIATLRARVSVGSVADFRKLVADFAYLHGFSHRQESTMPRQRKLFLVAGAFSTTFAAKDDAYLLMHNIVGKDCVVIDLYAGHDGPAMKALEAELEQTIEMKMAGKAKLVGRKECPDDPAEPHD